MHSWSLAILAFVPWQYGALSKIYGASPSPSDAAQATGLIMIGDPKQAIYSFRGADLNTYLTARHQAQAIHTLSGKSSWLPRSNFKKFFL